MKIKVISQNDDTARYSLEDVNSTVIEAIINSLNKNPNVAYARYIIDHPDLTLPMLEIKVTSGTPSEALALAAKDMQDYYLNTNAVVLPKVDTWESGATGKSSGDPTGTTGKSSGDPTGTTGKSHNMKD